MKLQNYIADQARFAAEEAFRYAAAVPTDKLEWVPQDGVRSVLDMCKELAKCPDWAYELIVPGGSFESQTEESRAAMKAEMDAWTTVEACHKACLEKLDRLAELYRSVPDERLSETKWLPYNGGREHTILEMLDYPRWNCNYHTGQIAYIQMLYGDKEIH